MGWSGGVFTRVRNWVTDKANSVNPQAALFDQEDDNFAAGLNNCVTKDGLNKPSSAMDWNGQNLTGILNLANTGTLNLLNGKLVGATSGTIITVNGVAAGISALLTDGVTDFRFSHSGGASTISTSTNTGFNLGTNGSNRISMTNAGATSIFGGGAGTAGLAVTSANLPQCIDDGGTLQTVGYRDMPQTNTSINYTLVAADRGRHILVGGAGAITLTIPANASVAYPIGTVITIINNSGGNVTLAITSDNLVWSPSGLTGSRTIASGGVVSFIKYASTGWYLTGSGIT